MPQFPYIFFEEYVVRTPVYSSKNFQKKAVKDIFSDDELKEISQDSIFQQAVYLASPNLYNELKKWIQSENKLSSNHNLKLKNTILKYYIRMSTRCTPFGLFSGVGLGEFTDETEGHKNLMYSESQIKDSKLDMHLLVSLAKSLEKNTEIRNQLLYFPNNSIYKVGKRIRYVEYEHKEGERNYLISSVPQSDELIEVLDFCRHGQTFDKLIEILEDKEISKEEARNFIDELIDNQILISELEPTVSGCDYLENIISVLRRLDAEKEAMILTNVKDKLNQVDINTDNSLSLYLEIADLIKYFKIEYEQKNLFQTDLYFKSKFKISKKWKNDIKNGFSFLNKITLLNKGRSIEHFKKVFYDRFETQEMPLSYVLDTEIGIGYLQNITVKGIHPYLEDLKLPFPKKKQDLQIYLSPFQRMLNDKLQIALMEHQFKITLNDEDIKDFDESWDDLPDTLSVMAEIIGEDNKEKLCIANVGGSSAANLLGRFCSDKSDIQNLTKLIAKKEEAYNTDSILAEVIHLPEARIGNVIRRPMLRKYEIPYLAKSVLPEENQINVNDLFISVKNDKLILRSKKLNKEVMPHLTNAHNFHNNTLPVYHFLCDLHSQNLRTSLYFDWGGLNQLYKFFPRVEYKNIIISKAQWRISEKDIESLHSIINNKDEFLLQIAIWRNKRQIPQWIQWVNSDHVLSLNLENYDMAKLFIQTVKSEKSIKIEEFLYRKDDDFRREFIFPMYKVRKNYVN